MPPVLNQSNLEDIWKKDFVTKKTPTFFTLLGVSREFLMANTDDWANDIEYTRTRECFIKMIVVNGVSESSVALI
jgi:hypothetical protein